jgi:hypothetical protein
VQSFEFVSRARELWEKAGPLASSFEISGAIEIGSLSRRSVLSLIVDAPTVGRKGSMTVRCHRSIFTERCDDENLKAVVDLLYGDVMNAIARSHSVGVRF